MINKVGNSDFVMICEHASNRIPSFLGGLGLDAKVLESHAAWDPGAMLVSELLSAGLDAPLISANYSRLIYDLNRPPESSEAIRTSSEIYPIKANENLGTFQKKMRIDAFYRPFHETVTALLDERAAQSKPTILITVHSFTPIYHGKVREVELGILHHTDSRIADILLANDAFHGGLNVQRNAPYGPQDGVAHTLDLHGTARGLPNVMLEIRNDLIAEPAQHQMMADTLLPLLKTTSQQFWLE